MRRVLGIRGGQGETLVPPTAVAGGDEGFVFEFEASDNNNNHLAEHRTGEEGGVALAFEAAVARKKEC
jgi:hypothetical protein